MQRIFPNLYRFDFGPKRKDNRLSHSYLIVRKSGNLLICHAKQGASVLDHADEIHELGGIDTQFVAHFHDAKRGDLHEAIHDRFGCKLSYHKSERQGVRSKTKCPEMEYGSEGLKLGTDFEAHFFPGHTPGMSIFSWKHRGKRFLFPSHVITLGDKGWGVNFTPHIAPELKSQFAGLAKMDVDVLVRGGSDETRAEFEKLSERTQKALQKEIRAKLKPPATAKKTKSNRKRLITGFIQEKLTDVIRETYDVEMVTGYGTCKIDVLEGYLAATDLIIFLGINRSLRPGHDFLDKLRNHVETGGSLLIGDARAGRVKRNWIVSSHPFPEIATLGDPATDIATHSQHDLTTDTTHPAVGGLAKQTTVSTEAYAGMTFEPGKAGTVLLRNAAGDPVCVAGQVGKGRVVIMGLQHMNETPLNAVEKQLYQGIVRWLAGEG